jgi:hypothetical protein
LTGLNSPSNNQYNIIHLYNYEKHAVGGNNNMDWVKERMYQARLQRTGMQQRDAADGVEPRQENLQTIATRHPWSSLKTPRLSWLTEGMVLGVLLMILAWWAGLIERGGSPAVHHATSSSPEQPFRLDQLAAQTGSADEMSESIADLAEQVRMLTATVSELREKLLRIEAKTDSIAALGTGPGSKASSRQDQISGTGSLPGVIPATAGMSNIGTSIVMDAGEPPDTTASALVAETDIKPTGETPPPEEAVRKNGPWVINLASLSHKEDAERFLAKARSKGVAAQIYKVTVKGTDYWRVQAAGFSTAAEAKANTASIKEKLKLRDVWVVMRSANRYARIAGT